jgi:hypothetical protein
MNSFHIPRHLTVLAILATVGGCSTWQGMDKTEGTVAGGAGGAVAGAVVAGPVGAVAGGIGGAYVGHETTGEKVASSAQYPSTSSGYDPALVRSVQQALNDKGYSAGTVDGRWGPSTEDAVRRFQQASGLPQSGELGRSTLVALGISSK